MATFLRDWTLEKHASIDWNNVEEIAAHNFTLHGLMDAHPQLRLHLEGQGPLLPLSQLFLSRDAKDAAEQRRLIDEWRRAGLYLMRVDRWCRRCGEAGHTLPTCFKEPQTKERTKPSPLERHRQLVTQATVRQLDAKVVGTAGGGAARGDAPPAQGASNRAANPLSRAAADMRKMSIQTAGFNQRPATVVDEQIYRGTVKLIDRVREFGEILVTGVGLVAFHMDRLLYGLKKTCVGDDIRCRIERAGERILAVDVRPVNAALTKDDVRSFIADCDAGGVNPIAQMRTILDQRHVWPTFLKCLQDLDPAQRHSAINVIVRMVTFRPNREPINRTLLRTFLGLLRSGTGETNFFPTAVLESIPTGSAALIQAETTATSIDMLMEISDFLIMLRVFADAPVDVVKPAVDAMNDLLQACASQANPPKPKLRYVTTNIERVTQVHGVVALLPSAEQLSVPACLPASSLHPSNLPVNVTHQYPTSEALVKAQCDLLLADTFTATSNVLAAACFQLPDFTPDASTLEDVKHARVFNNVTYLGRASAKDRDQVNGYMFRVSPQSSNISWIHSLQSGQFVCITTGNDRTRIDPSELFWGVVAAQDPDLIAQGVTILHSFDCDFQELIQRLARNQALGKPEQSMMLETAVFIHGYAPVMRALASFVGIGAAKLPLQDVILREQKPPCDTNIALVPPHFTGAHGQVMSGITKELILDNGQAATLSSLRHSPMVLVQGPPGTGKSFIGCRVVESVVRFKKAAASGTALRYVDVNLLPDCKPETLTPTSGPIVVITYKNHALDEFLVDLIRSGLWCGNARRSDGRCRCAGDFSGCCAKCCTHPASIVRIGGRSTAPELAPYNLGELMASKTAPRDVSQGRAKVFVIIRRVERLAGEIRALEQGDLSKAALASLITLEQATTLQHEELQSWLAGDRYIGKDTEVHRRCTQQLPGSPLDDMLAFKASQLNSDAVDPATAELDPDDGVQLTVMAAMKADMGPSERDTKALRNSMVSASALELIKLHQTGGLECPVPNVETLQSLWSLSPQQRHDVFVYWCKVTIAARAVEYGDAIDQLETATVLLDHARERARQDLLKHVDVIGLTTTGCAMHQNLLRSLKPSVLVVEEAAEILESQLLACFTESLTQVVLIGDHYQLQPKVETMALEKHNHMNVSLFERLVAHVQPEVLVEQRRMRSSIADLVRPFYDKDPLLDHTSVATRPYIDKFGEPHNNAVPGLAHDVFFWKHNHPEEMATFGRSKVNMLEADMALSVVKHLIQQGVRPASITVITPYLGQRRLLNNAIKAQVSRDVRVSTVDRFQGDEADVIVLSLVRTQALTEFIRMRNRMIVACSRARFAMVMIGSEELLLKSPHWAKVLAHLRAKNLVGDELPVVRRTAPTEIRLVAPTVKFVDWFPEYGQQTAPS